MITQMRVLMVGAALLLCSTLVSCSGSGESADDFPLTEQEIQTELDAAGESQRPSLEDGVITPAERERAYLNFVSCSAERGVEIYDYHLDPRGGDSFHSRQIGAGTGDETPPSPPGEPTGEGPSPVPAGAADLVVEECRQAHYVAVGLLYSYQNRLTGQELERFEADVAQCMRDGGADVPAGSSSDQMSEIDRNLHNECWVKNRG